jgi:hypothetical protein
MKKTTCWNAYVLRTVFTPEPKIHKDLRRYKYTVPQFPHPFVELFDPRQNRKYGKLHVLINYINFCISQHHCTTLEKQRDSMNFPDRITFYGYVDIYIVILHIVIFQNTLMSFQIGLPVGIPSVPNKDFTHHPARTTASPLFARRREAKQIWQAGQVRKDTVQLVASRIQAYAVRKDTRP